MTTKLTQKILDAIPELTQKQTLDIIRIINEKDSPYDRIARIQVETRESQEADRIIHDLLHEIAGLQAKVGGLEAEIRASSPRPPTISFGNSSGNNSDGYDSSGPNSEDYKYWRELLG